MVETAPIRFRTDFVRLIVNLRLSSHFRTIKEPISEHVIAKIRSLEIAPVLSPVDQFLRLSFQITETTGDGKSRPARTSIFDSKCGRCAIT